MYTPPQLSAQDLDLVSNLRHIGFTKVYRMSSFSDISRHVMTISPSALPQNVWSQVLERLKENVLLETIFIWVQCYEAFDVLNVLRPGLVQYMQIDTDIAMTETQKCTLDEFAGKNPQVKISLYHYSVNNFVVDYLNILAINVHPLVETNIHMLTSLCASLMDFYLHVTIQLCWSHTNPTDIHFTVCTTLLETKPFVYIQFNTSSLTYPDIFDNIVLLGALQTPQAIEQRMQNFRARMQTKSARFICVD